MLELGSASISSRKCFIFGDNAHSPEPHEPPYAIMAFEFPGVRIRILLALDINIFRGGSCCRITSTTHQNFRLNSVYTRAVA